MRVPDMRVVGGQCASGKRLRIVVCDRSGHPFQVQLSRELARRGHHVLHLYWSDFLTPHGPLSKQSEDPCTFHVEGLSIGESHAKEAFIRRRMQEKRFGRLALERSLEFNPDVFLACNMPLDAQTIVSAGCARRGVKLVFWLQDIYSAAISSVLCSKVGAVGRVIGKHYERIERRLLERSDVVVCISSDFIDIIESWNIPIEKCVLVPNWAPLNGISVGYKKNSWAQSRGFNEKIVIMYSGTIGFKHNIDFLLTAARHLRNRQAVILLVISEGEQVERLKVCAAKEALRNIEVLPFQPYETYSDVLSTADVLLSFIDPDAGRYSVPSKVLTYLCAGRPIVLAAPEANLASKTVSEAEAGLVVPADAPSMFAESIADLVDDDTRRTMMGRNARGYAEAHFDIGRIADRFEAILAPAAAVPRKTRSGFWRASRGQLATGQGGWPGGIR